MYKRVLIVTLLCLFIFSCRRQVTRISPDQQIDLSGRWNDTDSKQIAESMISQVMGHSWREDFFSKYERKPVVIVGLFINKSHEHVATETITKDLEKEFLNSGLVRIVQSDLFREKLRTERSEQQDFASPETQKKWGKELGADFMLFGTLNSIVDTYKKQKVVTYKVNLELSDLETNEKVWLGDKEIKKYIRR